MFKLSLFLFLFFSGNLINVHEIFMNMKAMVEILFWHWHQISIKIFLIKLKTEIQSVITHMSCGTPRRGAMVNNLVNYETKPVMSSILTRWHIPQLRKSRYPCGNGKLCQNEHASAITFLFYKNIYFYFHLIYMFIYIYSSVI